MMAQPKWRNLAGAVLLWTGPFFGPVTYAQQTIEDNSVTTGDNSNVVLGGDQYNTFTVNLQDTQVKARLLARREELRAALAVAPESEKPLIEAQLGEVERQLADLEATTRAASAAFANSESALLDLAEDLEQARVLKAMAALARGDTTDAKAAFAEIRAKGQATIERNAEAAFQQGMIAEVEIRWKEASGYFADSARLAPNLERLGKAQEYAWRMGRYRKAREYGHTRLELVEQDPGTDTPEHVAALNNLALMYKASGQYDDAEPLYRKAIDIDRLFLDADGIDYAARVMNYANLLRRMKRFKDAEPLMREGIEINRKHLDPDHPRLAIGWNNLGLLLSKMGRLEEAEPHYREAIRIDMASPAIGTKHPQYATHIANLAVLLRDLGRYEEAAPLFRESLRIDRATIGDKHPSYALNLGEYAVLLDKTGQTDMARKTWAKTFRIYMSSISADHPRTKEAAAKYAAFLRTAFPGDEMLGKLEAVFGPDIGKE